MVEIFEILDIILVFAILYYGSYYWNLFNKYGDILRENIHSKGRLEKELKKKNLEESSLENAIIIKEEITSFENEINSLKKSLKEYQKNRNTSLIIASICTIIAFYMETVNYINFSTGLILRKLSKGSTIAYAALFCGIGMIALKNFVLKYKSIDVYEKKEKIASNVFVFFITILVFLSVVLFVNLLFTAIAFMFSIEM